MKNLLTKIRILAVAFAISLTALSFAPHAAAIPFGEGKFGAYQFGSPTSLSLALSGNVNLNLTSDGSKYSASGSHTVTVTTSDVYGYTLYAYALNNSAMTQAGSSSTIPASANSTASALSTNSWGYNLDGSSNYLGLPTTSTIVKTASSGPYPSGDTSTVTYGVVTDLTKTPGAYTVSVVYTAAVPIQ